MPSPLPETLVGFEAGRLREVFDSLLEGVQVLSPQWRYLYVNEAVAKQGRKGREELLGRTVQECYPGFQDTPLFSVLERCMGERRLETLESEFQYEDGEQAWFELRIQPCREGLVVLSLDITKRKRLEATARQNEKLTALGRMAASVAHDLKNILNPIALNVELLKRQTGTAAPPIRALLSQIEGAIKTGSDLTEDLRRFSRQESDGEAELVDLNEVLTAGLEVCMPRIRERAAIDLRRLRGDAPQVLVRRSGLVAGIVNLVANALDALPARGGRLTVSTGASRGGGFVEIADDGPGMPPEVEQRAFEPFFTTKSRGTGLGLSTLYAFLQSHHGHLALTTAVGHGTKVRLWFPAAPQPEDLGG